MMASTLILASASPRRRELLTGMGVAFEVVTAQVEELDAGTASHLTPAELAIENARLKAAAVARAAKGRWVLGADTVVALTRRVHQRSTTGEHRRFLRATILGKPASLEQARDFLRALSGQTHEVITACALVDLDGGEEIFHDITLVTFRVLEEETIARYLTEVHVLDKAGAYALQERGEWIVERVEGSRSNVIGLPCEALEKVLLRRGLL